jgi:hypothetical protein
VPVIAAEVGWSEAVSCSCGTTFLISYLARVDIQVLEGALVEVPMADVTGMDRRAFGEFVGPHGELASYAFGWTTGSDPHIARLSIGIGAGNHGGSTFHAVIFGPRFSVNQRLARLGATFYA